VVDVYGVAKEALWSCSQVNAERILVGIHV